MEGTEAAAETASADVSWATLTAFTSGVTVCWATMLPLASNESMTSTLMVKMLVAWRR